MGRIEDDLAKIFGYIFMFLMILRVVVATDLFSIYKSLIGFMFALIMIYICKRVVYVEKKLDESNDNTKRGCDHDFMFLDKWQDAKTTYWEFGCRWCLAIDIQGQKHCDLVKDRKKRRGL